MTRYDDTDALHDWHELPEEDAQKVKALAEQQLLPVEVAGKRICISKISGQYLAINNRCPHAGTPFHLGSCNKKGIVVCPTHHYKFDMKTGLSADGNHYKLPTYKIRVTSEGISIGIRKI